VKDGGSQTASTQNGRVRTTLTGTARTRISVFGEDGIRVVESGLGEETRRVRMAEGHEAQGGCPEGLQQALFAYREARE